MAKTKNKKQIKTNKKVSDNIGLHVLGQIFQNAITSRSAGLSRLLNIDKDINYECGYPTTIATEDYKAIYDREGIGTRVVRLLPEECWQMLPSIEENQDAKETEFEKQWKDLEKKFHLYHYLRRIDVLSGIGRFGVLLLGISDGKKMYQPVKGINAVTGEKVGKSKYQLLYLRPFDESVVSVKSKETDITSPRYGLPVTYEISFENTSASGTISTTNIVHWTRVLHIADNREISEINGVPRMKPVYNRLLDLRKIVAGSGEMFWKGGFPGLVLKLMEGAALNDDAKTALRAQIKDYQDGLQRWLSPENIEVKELNPQIADPEPHVKVQIQYICCTLGIPYRIFMGSEAAHLASTEDKETWNSRLKDRQENYISPMVIRLLIDRLIMYGVLPEVPEYTVQWPDLGVPSEKEAAEIAGKKTEALAKYVAGSVNELIPPKEYLTMILGMRDEDAQAVIDAAEKFGKKIEDEERDMEEEPSENPEDVIIEDEV